MGITNPSLPNTIPSIRNCFYWFDWLQKVDMFLKDRGYKRYTGHVQKEDYCYLKTFKNTLQEDIFQVGCLVYDFRESDDSRVSISYICFFTGLRGRFEFKCSSDTVSVQQFEDLCYEMYYKLSKKLD